MLGAASIASILASHNIMKKRNVALAAAYAAVDKSFKDYRDRVIERFGEQVEKELRYNIKAQERTGMALTTALTQRCLMILTPIGSRTLK